MTAAGGAKEVHPMKLFLNTPIEGSPPGAVSTRISDYLRHKLYFSERFDEDEPESKLEFYVREAMRALAIVQCLLAEHADLSDEISEAEGEMRGDIEHDDAHAVRVLLERIPRFDEPAKVRPSKAIRNPKSQAKRSSKRARPRGLSLAGKLAIKRAAMKRWRQYREEMGRKVSGS
jgi:hypothetical protein